MSEEIMFKKKIQCFYCKKFHVAKVESNKVKYICGFYNRKSTNCVRNLVSQEQIMELLFLRFRKELSIEEIDEFIDNIQITEDKIQINFYNEKEVILSNTFAQF